MGEGSHNADSWETAKADVKTQEARLKLNRPRAVCLFLRPVALILGLTVKSSGGGEERGMDREREGQGGHLETRGRNYSRNVLLLSPKWVVVYLRGG